ncbi:Hypothetical protein GSB_155332 [Giardia duodenalis]|uniref:Pyrroline-5-carboxylate reductase catalytic N-terminal domain-containing protein n=1 Tax=Giardia intestinalis TaxID=5741 RepID=V6TN14_GIAIN|nr:Hypothetical protein GSB_155332 [Giardia intestinalis]
MEQWYEKAVASLIKRPYYSKAVNMVHSASYADTSFINHCISVVDSLGTRQGEHNINRVPGASSYIVVVGTGRVAQLVLRDVLLPKKAAVKVLSLGGNTVHSEQITELGVFVTTDLNILLSAELILLCLPAVDSAAVETHIANFSLEDKVVRFTSFNNSHL